VRRAGQIAGASTTDAGAGADVSIWSLPEPTDAETQAAVVAQLTRAADDHYALAMAAMAHGLWDMFAEHQIAMDRVLVALRNEARESASWSTVG